MNEILYLLTGILIGGLLLLTGLIFGYKFSNNIFQAGYISGVSSKPTDQDNTFDEVVDE